MTRTTIGEYREVTSIRTKLYWYQLFKNLKRQNYSKVSTEKTASRQYIFYLSKIDQFLKT